MKKRQSSQVATIKRWKKAVPKPRRSLSTPSRTGFPKQQRITHVLAVNGVLLTESPYTATQFAAFGVNCLYDPGFGAVTQQPQYFDQMAALYEQYTVLSSKFEITFNASTNTTVPFMAGVFINDDETAPFTSPVGAQQQPSATWKSTTNNNSITICKTWSAKEAFGGNTRDNDELQGTVAANPALYQVFMPFMRGIQTDVATSVRYTVRVTYDTVWDKLVPLAAS